MNDNDMVKIDTEFKQLIPPLAIEEYQGLESSIKANGCRVPLDVWNSILVDGHNRYEICTRNNIPYKTKEIAFADRTAAILWIIGNQLNRRNLQSIDRIALVAKQDSLLGSIKEKAKENLKTSTGGLNPQPMQNSAQAAITTRQEIAKLAGVSHDTYKKGVEILKKATPEVLTEMRDKKKSINSVFKEMKKEETTAKRVESRKEAAKKIATLDSRIQVVDFRDKFDLIPDNSLSLIFTDPPYDQKSKELFPAIAEFAKQKLISGGSLVCYVGQLQLAEAMMHLQKQLRYWWTFCCLHSGSKPLIREYGVRNGWKPVLWYVKDTREDVEAIVQDVISGGKEKTDHEWQQAVSEAEYCIENLCPPDGIVCDLFLGSGTTAIAANKLKRQWIGFEINSDTAKIASERIAR